MEMGPERTVLDFQTGELTLVKVKEVEIDPPFLVFLV